MKVGPASFKSVSCQHCGSKTRVPSRVSGSIQCGGRCGGVTHTGRGNERATRRAAFAKYRQRVKTSRNPMAPNDPPAPPTREMLSTLPSELKLVKVRPHIVEPGPNRSDVRPPVRNPTRHDDAI